MEWLNSLRGAILAVDTSPFIYLIEEHPKYIAVVRPIFEGIACGEIRAVSSVLTLSEVLVHPLRRGDRELAARYRSILLHSAHLTIVPVIDSIAEKAAELRSQYGLRTPDAIHLATAIHMNASAFLTNDSRLPTLGLVNILAQASKRLCWSCLVATLRPWSDQ